MVNHLWSDVNVGKCFNSLTSVSVSVYFTEFLWGPNKISVYDSLKKNELIWFLGYSVQASVDCQIKECFEEFNRWNSNSVMGVYFNFCQKKLPILSNPEHQKIKSLVEPVRRGLKSFWNLFSVLRSSMYLGKHWAFRYISGGGFYWCRKLPESEGIPKEEREFHSSRTEGIQNEAFIVGGYDNGEGWRETDAILKVTWRASPSAET